MVITEEEWYEHIEVPIRFTVYKGHYLALEAEGKEQGKTAEEVLEDLLNDYTTSIIEEDRLYDTLDSLCEKHGIENDVD